MYNNGECVLGGCVYDCTCTCTCMSREYVPQGVTGWLVGWLSEALVSYDKNTTQPLIVADNNDIHRLPLVQIHTVSL